MTWRPRKLGEGLCYHVRVQCNHKAFYFEGNEDFERYLFLLSNLKIKLGFVLHHYVLMSTHVHLILTTPGPVLLSRIMQRINHLYALDYHKRHARQGHFWINSFRESVIDSDSYALTCMRYLDRNPVRAKIVQSPDLWPWSSHIYYANGTPNPLIDPHPSYIGLSSRPTTRQSLYQKFVHQLFPTDEQREQIIIRNTLRRYGTKL